MRFLTIISALVASSAIVAAAPAPEKQAPAANCPNGWTYCGECNGTSCKVGLSNHACEVGKCTVQSGGGDGKPCGWTEYIHPNAPPTEGPVTCPGRG
ncbi:hypothetical protein VTN00DRAFT_4996 [Thermoascus crustaceus]|uniref:uncharacterized protein n=1 Tax=Thermoascus crustaceus TaxID=5088 RepID=UPI003743E2FA